MNGAGAIEVGEFSLPGAGRGEALETASAFHSELARLWRADREAGLGWRSELGVVTLEADPRLGAKSLGEVVAREVRRHALTCGEAR